jgi:rare lipoprotein A
VRPQSILRIARPRTAATAALIALPFAVAAPLPAGSANAQTAASAPETPTRPAPVAKAAHLTATSRRLHVLAGQTATVRGYVRPAQAGRLVRLERLRAGGWRPVDHARTGPNGRFVLRYRPGGTTSVLMRLVFPGDRVTSRATRVLGRLNVYRATRASRYDLYGGALACGGRLRYDSLVVAHRSLPCGTMVTIRHRGRTVRARVQDRGPFVGGREFDLAGAVARRLGFNGVGPIWVTA